MKRILTFVAALGLVAACGKTGVFFTERFACNTSGDCADGFSCSNGECTGTNTGGGGGEDDGGMMGGGAATGGGGTTGGGGGTTGGGGGTTGGGGGTTGGGGGTTGGGGGDAGVDAGIDAGMPRDAGVSCTATSQCLAGLTCTDGVCCTTSCSNSCDSCNQSGNAGTCLPRNVGTVVGACGAYTCNGSAVSCPTMCDPDAGANLCAPGNTCLGSSCTRCWSAFTSAFPTPNDPAWNLNNVTTNLVLSVSVQSRSNMPTSVSASPIETLPLRNCGVSLQLVTPPEAFPGYEGNIRFVSTSSNGPRFGFRFDTRGLLAAWSLSDGGTGEQLIPPTADGGWPAWLRIDENAGSIRWRTTNATTFTTVHSLNHGGENLSSMRLEFTGTYPQQPGTDRTTFEVDNLNLGPP